jgi:lysophospholipase L1-like esterase
LKPRPARPLALLLVTLCAVSVPAPTRAQQQPSAPGAIPFELLDGDRVAFIGNAFFEREQKYSYLETVLLTRWPDRNVTFRNLAWSGDTVFGHARAAFDTPVQGFERLVKVAHEVKPTVVFISYGMAESFEGEKGLPEFRTGLEKLLDHLSDLHARTILVGPIRHENLGPPLPDPAAHNKDLRKYIETMKSVADGRGFRFIDLYALMSQGNEANTPRPKEQLTENGIHLSPLGYWRAALAIQQGLGLPKSQWKPGPHGEITGGSGADTAEKIRQLAIAKNVQFFNQWRPENQTYLFGFRRNEQGQNAKEIPMFDPPIAKIETEIAKLRSALKGQPEK